MADVLAVFAHPDDEVLGAGATLARHVREGDTVGVIAYCITRAHAGFAPACMALGASFSCLGLPDQLLDDKPLSKLVEELAQWGTDPDIVYTHSPHDLNLDHELVARAVLTAFRPLPGQKPRVIYGCEVASSSEYAWKDRFEPNWWVAVSDEDVEAADKAMRCYASETRDYPHPRSPIAINARRVLRGSQVGVDRAEAFQLLRGHR